MRKGQRLSSPFNRDHYTANISKQAEAWSSARRGLKQRKRERSGSTKSQPPLQAGSSPAALRTCLFLTTWLGRGLLVLPTANLGYQRRNQQKILTWSTEQALRTAVPGRQVPGPSPSSAACPWPLCVPGGRSPQPGAGSPRFTPVGGGGGGSGCAFGPVPVPLAAEISAKASPPAPQRAASPSPSSVFSAPHQVPAVEDETRAPPHWGPHT